MAGEKLARKILDQSVPNQALTDLIYGQVTSVNPLKIQVSPKLTLDGRFLELSPMVRDLSVSITIDGKMGSGQVFRNLRAGDRVKMLRVSNGNKYYVLERG